MNRCHYRLYLHNKRGNSNIIYIYLLYAQPTYYEQSAKGFLLQRDLVQPSNEINFNRTEINILVIFHNIIQYTHIYNI